MSRRLPLAANGGGPSLSGDQSVRSTRSTRSSSARLPPPSLLCNRCNTPLATTCFLCACDCIFCEGEFCRFMVVVLLFFSIMFELLFTVAAGLVISFIFIFYSSSRLINSIQFISISNQIVPTAILKIAPSAQSVPKRCETMISQSSSSLLETVRPTISLNHRFKPFFRNNPCPRAIMPARPFHFLTHASLSLDKLMPSSKPLNSY